MKEEESSIKSTFRWSNADEIYKSEEKVRKLN
jgi:hypothetical protein